MEQKSLFTVGGAYEPYMGRWSRLVAREFLDWLNLPPDLRWLDVGCGTGALSQTVLDKAAPSAITAIDRSEAFADYARAHVTDERAVFMSGDAQALPFEPASFEAVISGLVLNFVPNPSQTVAEMSRVAVPGGTIAVYVWDYTDGMQMLRYFWQAAIALDPSAAEHEEGHRFAICHPEPLATLCNEVGLQSVEVRAIEVPMHFQNFDDYWKPFLGGQGPAASYLMSLAEQDRQALADQLRAHLPTDPDGSIPLTTRAWAVRSNKAG